MAELCSACGDAPVSCTDCRCCRDCCLCGTDGVSEELGEELGLGDDEDSTGDA